MARWMIWRLAQALFTLVGVAGAVFFALRVTGDPAVLLAPDGATYEQIDLLRRQLGLDRPVLVQFAHFLSDLMRGDFGTSVAQRLPVTDLIAARLPNSLLLSGAAFMLAMAGGVMLGLARIKTEQRWWTPLVDTLILAGQSTPSFVAGLILILTFSVWLRLLPSSGAETSASLILPACTLGAYSLALMARLTRTAISEELAKPYCLACLARGLSRRSILYRHALRNAAPTLVALAALEAGNLFAGTIIVETVFAWPGLGQLLLQSVQARDFPVIQAIVLMVALVYILARLVADVLEVRLHPGMRAVAP